MKSLLDTLHNYDPGMLPALAEIWGVNSKSLANDELIEQLGRAMLDPERMEANWDALDEQGQGALQFLVSSPRGRTRSVKFERLYGKIRIFGRGQVEREKPHLQGESTAESLYYLGFIGKDFDKVEDELADFIYVPQDLIPALPLHKTSYLELDGDGGGFAEDLPALDPIDDAGEIQPADTSIVDDMTTLLASLQMRPAEIEGERFAPAIQDNLAPLLLRPQEERLAFMLYLGISANLIATQDGKAYPQRQQARTWLNATRAEQIRELARAWLESQAYRDMWHIPGLYPDDSGFAYDAAAARQTIMGLLSDLLPEHDWASINELIGTIKEFEPDFQRPYGDFDSWYIRNEAGQFLKGFESWDAVEGALIEFYLLGPMHWLGLVDIGEDVIRLTAYGRAFLQLSTWPQPAEPATKIEIGNDGSLRVSRRVNRFERFQLARFARCLQAGDPYVYLIDPESIQRAASQDISAKQIEAFVARQLDGAPLPQSIAKLLRQWQDGPKTTVTFESMIVLRSTSEDVLEKIFSAPAFRRYLGARLGATACVIRADQWEALRAELGEHGIEVDISQLSIE